MNKEELFNETIQTIDTYNEAVEKNAPEALVDALDRKIDKLYGQIKENGLMPEFDDYSFGF